MTVAKNATTSIGAVGGNSGIVELKGKFKLVLNGTFTGTFKLLKRYKDQVSVGIQAGGDGDAALDTDAVALPYVADELIGAWISNDTKGSFGPVTDNTTTVVTATQVGGTAQDWDDGDIASIWEEVASYTTAQYVEIEEPEAGVDYVVVCSAYSSGTARVRISN